MTLTSTCCRFHRPTMRRKLCVSLVKVSLRSSSSSSLVKLRCFLVSWLTYDTARKTGTRTPKAMRAKESSHGLLTVCSMWYLKRSDCATFSLSELTPMLLAPMKKTRIIIVPANAVTTLLSSIEAPPMLAATQMMSTRTAMMLPNSRDPAPTATFPPPSSSLTTLFVMASIASPSSSVIIDMTSCPPHRSIAARQYSAMGSQAELALSSTHPAFGPSQFEPNSEYRKHSHCVPDRP
mmetsp:Transcript_34092/g.79873  ORF Transcript_34092/g.79873 Transcript_34092/m.79873 type:complete len:236 (-) Transcript_34092:1181-1888(-)